MYKHSSCATSENKYHVARGGAAMDFARRTNTNTGFILEIAYWYTRVILEEPCISLRDSFPL